MHIDYINSKFSNINEECSRLCEDFRNGRTHYLIILMFSQQQQIFDAEWSAMNIYIRCFSC